MLLTIKGSYNDLSDGEVTVDYDMAKDHVNNRVIEINEFRGTGTAYINSLREEAEDSLIREFTNFNPGLCYSINW